jgi:acylphosphatase
MAYRIRVTGMVQGVGYRAYVKMMAQRLGVKGQVRNLDDGSVEIIAVADEVRLKRFVRALDVKAETPFEPHVESISVEECEPEGEFTTFSVDYGYEMTIAEREMLERSEIGILAFSWMGKFLAGKIDHLGEKMDKGFAELKEEIWATREELKDEIRATREEVRLTREELGGKLDESIRRTEKFHSETVTRFDYLDAKYGEFGARMSELERDIKEMKDIMKEMKDAFIRLVNHVTGK